MQRGGKTQWLWRAERQTIPRNLPSTRNAGIATARQLPVTNRAHKAGVVGDAHGAAIIALLDMAAECCRPACRNGAHDAPLDAAEMPGAGLPKRFAMAAEDVRHLQNRSHGVRSAGWHDLQTKPVKRAWRVADGLGGDLGVARGAGQAGVAEQHLDDAHVGPVLQQMRREAVS